MLCLGSIPEIPPATIHHTQPLTITWSTGFAGVLLQFISALPHTFSNSGIAQGSLDVTQIYTGPVFTPPGVDYATTSFTDGFDIGPVAYQ